MWASMTFAEKLKDKNLQYPPCKFRPLPIWDWKFNYRFNFQNDE